MRRDAGALEPRGFAAAVGGADAGDEIDRGAEMGEPRRLIGRRSAGPVDDRGAPVGAARERPLGLDDRVDHQVADDENARRGGRRPAFGHRRVSSTATCAATIALFSTSAMLASRLRPPVSSTMRPSRNGVTSFLAIPLAFASATASAMRASIACGVDRLVLGDRVGDQQPAGADFALQPDHAGEVVQAVAAVVELEAARAGVEGREFVAAEAADGDAVRFEIFERLVDIEDRLGAGADDRDLRSR